VVNTFEGCSLNIALINISFDGL